MGNGNVVGSNWVFQQELKLKIAQLERTIRVENGVHAPIWCMVDCWQALDSNLLKNVKFSNRIAQ